MKRFFKFILFVGILGVIGYFVKNALMPKNNDFARAENGDGVMPANMDSSFDSRPLGGQISPELLKILVCPEDKGALELIEEGAYLLNPRNGYRYPIRGGIPVMLIEEGKKNQEPSLIRNNGAGA